MLYAKFITLQIKSPYFPHDLNIYLNPMFFLPKRQFPRDKRVIFFPSRESL